MTFPLTGLGASNRSPEPVRDRRELGRDQFLELLVTQLRYQDPLSPLQADEFAAQLAQFSSVEQLSKLNDAFAESRSDAAERTLLEKTALGSSLIGRQVVVQGDFITVANDGSSSIRVAVAGGGGQATLRLIDSAGQVVATQDLGAVSGGLQTLRPSSTLPPGTYRYQLDVTDRQGKSIDVVPFTEGVVDGVLFEEGSVWLKMGSIRIPLDKLSEITH